MCHRERQGWLVHIPRSTEVRGKRLNNCPDCEIGKLPKLRLSSAKRQPPIFCADCELGHIHPRITGPRWGSPDGASRFQCPGWQGRLALYCAGGLVLWARLNGGDVARHRPDREDTAGYPNRSLLRRGLDTRSTSQSIQTTAMPRPTTTPKNSNVKPGAVSMATIHNTLQVAYQ
jgi:hypothetical protein